MRTHTQTQTHTRTRTHAHTHNPPSGNGVVCCTVPNCPRPTSLTAATRTIYGVVCVSPSNRYVRRLFPVIVSFSSTSPPLRSCTMYPLTGAKSLVHGSVQLTLMKLYSTASTVTDGARGSPAKSQQSGAARCSS